MYSLVRNISSNDDGVASGPVFQEIRPGAGFKTGDSVKGKLEGLRCTVERSLHRNESSLTRSISCGNPLESLQ